MNNWTKEKCKEEALKYKTYKEFVKNSGSAYNVIYKNKWIDELCSHLIKGRNSNGYWTKEKCEEEALKYKFRGDFSKNSSGAYKVSIKNGWIEDICKHTIGCKFNGYWTSDRCKEEALKYTNRNDFSKNYPMSDKKDHKNEAHLCLE